MTEFLRVTQLLFIYGVQGFVLWGMCFLVGVGWWLWSGRGTKVRRLANRLLPVGVFYGLYCWLASYGGKPSVQSQAVRNGESIVLLERFLHIGVERWFYALDVKGSASFYDWAEIMVTVAVVSYVATTAEGRHWRLCRNSLAVIVAVGFLVFFFVPVAPPRLLPSAFGFSHFGLGALSVGADEVAALPSMHTAFAGWVAVVLWYLLPGRWRWLGPAYVIATAVCVLATGNHYVTDVIAGELLALAAARLPLTRVPCYEGGDCMHWSVRRAARCEGPCPWQYRVPISRSEDPVGVREMVPE